MNFNQSYNKLIGRIKSVRATQNLIDLGSSMILSFSVISLIVFSASLIEYFAFGDETFRKTLFYGSLGAIAVTFVLGLAKPVASIFSERFNYSISELAKKIGEKFPEIKDRLLNAMQMKSVLESGNLGSKDLANSAFIEAYKASENKDFFEILDKSNLKKSLIFFLSILGILAVSFFLSNGMSSSIDRIANYEKSYLPPIPFNLALKDLDEKIKRGSDLKIIVEGEGEMPETIELYLKEAQQENFENFKLRLDTGNIYNFSIRSLKTSLEFFAKGDFLNRSTFTDTLKVEVFDLPFVKSISGKVNFPRYTGISSQKLDNNNADITALNGSNAKFELKANTALDSAKIEFNPAREINDSSEVKSTYFSLKTEKDSAKGGFTINRSGTYKFRLFSEGLINENPIEYRVLALQDDYPSIKLVQPETDVQLSSKAILPIKVDISDDYGLDKLYLNYKLIFSKYVDPDSDFQKIEIQYNQKGRSLEIPYIWDLNKLGISPEDKFEFYLEIFDNDIVNGPKSSKTQILKLRLPSLDEAFEEAELAQKEIESELEEVLKESKELNEKIEELKNDLRKDAKNTKMNWQQKKESKDVFDKREELKEKVEKLSEKLDNTSKQMQDNQMLSKETLEKYQKLQELMKEISNPEIQEQSMKIKEQLNKMTPEQMQKALEKTQLSDEQFQQQIERSMKMLKKIQAEQKMDEIAKKAKEMQKEQESIQKALNKDNLSKKDQNKLENQQKALQDKLGDLENEMKELAEIIKQTGNEEVAKDFEQAVNKLNPENTKENLVKAEQEMNDAFQKQEQAQQMQQNNPQQAQQMQKQAQQSKKSAQQKQQKVQENMSEFAQKMQQMKQKMQQKALQKMINDMKKTISDLLQLSEKQEQLKENTRELSANSTKLPEIQNKQGDISQSLNSVAKKLMELSQKSFEIKPEMAQEISKAMKEMTKSAKELSERRPNRSTQNQQSSMAALNKAAMQMQSGLEKMQQQAQQQQQGGNQRPGGPGKGQGQGQGQMPSPSFGQQLQQAAAQQQLLKQSIQRMMKQQGQSKGQGGGQSGGGKKGKDPKDKKTGQYGRLKNEVGNAQKSMEELAEEQKKSAKGDKKIENELRKISDEMKEILADIESGNINEKTLEKQERILSRLLDASRSVNERDYQKKREAKTGKDYNIEDPNDIDWESRLRKKQMEEMLKLLEAEYTKDYELIIKKYFEELKKENVEMN